MKIVLFQSTNQCLAVLLDILLYLNILFFFSPIFLMKPSGKKITLLTYCALVAVTVNSNAHLT